MKPVLRALVWLGLGGGIGFFAGWQFGEKRAMKDIDESCEQAREESREDFEDRLRKIEKEFEEERDSMRAQYEAAVDAVRSYKGYDTADGDSVTTYITPVEVPAWATKSSTQRPVIVEEDMPEMPMDEPEMPVDPLGDDEEIQQLHPEDLRPYGITRAEFVKNEKGYDQVDLDYYTDDCVIFDPRNEEKWTHPEQLLGIGWKARFISTKDHPVREVYIQNDTMETLYRITRIDDSFERLYEEE